MRRSPIVAAVLPAVVAVLSAGLVGADRLLRASAHDGDLRPPASSPPPQRRRLRAALLLAAGAAPALLLEAAEQGGGMLTPLSFDEMDENGDGSVDKVEFMLHMRDAMHSDDRELVKDHRKVVYSIAEDLYKFCDVDGDGVLGPLEFEYLAHLAVASHARVQELQRSGAPAQSPWRPGDGRLQEMDTDGDGVVSRSELKVAVKSMLRKWGFEDEHDFEGPGFNRFVADKAREAEVNGSGKLDEEQEVRSFELFMFEGVADQLVAIILQEMDTNADGIISWQEVARSVLRELGMADDRTIPASVNDAFLTADLNQDGRLDSAELFRLAGVLLATGEGGSGPMVRQGP